MEIMDKQLTKVGLILIGLFFVILLVIPYIIPVRGFVASTSPESFPFQLPSANCVSLSSMPDDHVVLCYASNGQLLYKESYTRGLSWYDSQLLVDKNTSNIEDLNVNVAESGNSKLLLIAWDALTNSLNQSSRRAFYAVANTSGQVPVLLYGPARCSTGTGKSIERFPTLAGDPVSGFRLAWLTNGTGNYTIQMRQGNDLTSFGTIASLDVGNETTGFSEIIENPSGSFSLFYLQSNVSSQRIIYRNLATSTSEIIFSTNMSSGNITAVDYSITQSNDIVISFEKSDGMSNSTENLYYFTARSNYALPKYQQVENSSTMSFLRHTTFTNNQVLTIWLQQDDGNSSAYDILYIITDFNMTNKNSTYDSILLAYIMFACGIFNFFVYLHLKKSNRFENESEPLNNLSVTGCFIAIAALMILPFSGFQGEQLGASYADGFIYPAPINLATIIVIGFVFLFFLASTPLIDRFWRRDPVIRETRTGLVSEQKPFSWKQETLRKVPHMMMALLIIGFDPIGSHAMQYVAIQKYNQYNFINEGAIIFDYVLRLNNLEIGSYAVKIMMTAGLIFLWVLDLHILLASPTRYFFLKDYMRYAARAKEKSSMADFVVMFSSILLMIIVLTFNPAFKLQGTFASFGGFCAICFGDTAGVIFGKSMGKHKLEFQTNSQTKRSKKSWEGLIAGGILTFSTSLIFLTWPFALIVMTIYIVVDLVTPKIPISDNMLIPLLVALVFLPLLPLVQSPLMGFYVP